MAERRGPRPELLLLVGEESFLRDRRAREVVAELAPADNPDYNQESFRGPDVDLDLVVSACDLLPVFAEHRLVVLRHLDWKAAAAHERFIAYLRKPNPSTTLVVVSDPPAARRGEGSASGEEGEKKASKGKKGIAAKDLLALFPRREEFPALRAEAAADFARRAARERGFDLAADVARELVDLVGSEAGRIDDEIEKAVLYLAGKKKIGTADIELLSRRTRSHTMFELTDAIAQADREAVLAHLGALLEDGSEPVMLIGMIAWHLRRTLRGAALLEAGRPAAEAARAVGVYWKLADRFATSCRKLGTRGAVKAIRSLRIADRRIKSSGESERIVLERTLLEALAPVA